MSDPASKPGKGDRDRWTWKDTLWVLAVPAAALLLFTFVLAIGNVSGSSMAPLYGDDTIIIASRWSQPECQDIVMIQSSALNEMIVKRVIGLPGDTVELRGDAVFRNHQQLDEPYVEYSDPASLVEEFVVPEGMLFVLGDNRPVSLDSRSSLLGLVPEDEVVGPVFFSFQSPFSLNFLKALKQ